MPGISATSCLGDATMTLLVHEDRHSACAVSLPSLVFTPHRSGAEPAHPPSSVAVLPNDATAPLLDVVIDPALGRITVYGELNPVTRRIFADALVALAAFHPGEITVDIAGLTAPLSREQAITAVSVLDSTARTNRSPAGTETEL